VSRIEAKESLEQCSMGTRLMIIELRNTMKAENYLYEIEPQVASTGKLSGRGPGASVTRAAVRMEVEKNRDVNRAQECIQTACYE